MATIATLTPRQHGITTIVKQLLTFREMTQSDLAREVGCHQVQVNKSLNGKRRWSIEDLEAMAEVFGVPVSRFFEDPEVLFPGLVAESPRTESNRRPSHYE